MTFRLAMTVFSDSQNFFTAVQLSPSLRRRDGAARSASSVGANVLFSALTYNPAAVPIDHEYAETTEFGKPFINLIFTLGLVVGLSVQGTMLGATVGNLGCEEVAVPKQVFAGDTIHAQTRVVAARDSKSRPDQGIVTFEHRGFNQRDKVIATCRRVALMVRKPA